jgi:predicted GNAT superfamily acetyltransferase
MIQRDVWDLPELELVPAHMLRAFSEHGGLVLNAYNGAGKPLGTSIGFLGTQGGRRILYSHITGVLAKGRTKGVGLALKLEQRRYAIHKGLKLICWTYDPTQALNNWFNLNKIGAITRTYYINYYGKMNDSLNRGLDSDRLLAEWWVDSPRVAKRVDSKTKPSYEEHLDSTIVNPTMERDGVRIPTGEPELRTVETRLLLEIPNDYARLRKIDSHLLQKWRVQARKAYMFYFKHGYIATGLAIDRRPEPRSFVILERRSLTRILKS